VLGEGLLTSEAELHRRQRRLIQPLFHQRRVAYYERTFAECAERAQARWRDGQLVDVHAEMTRLTLAIVGRALFDADVEGDADAVGAALTESLEAVNRLVYPWGGLVDRLPVPATRRFHDAERVLDDAVARMIDERRRAGAVGDDLLSLLLATRGEEGRAMPDRQVRDEAMTIFIAGHETTANLLTWTLYLLAGHPDVERAVLVELANGRFDLLDRVLHEALRLYPPAWVIGRRALADVDLGPVVVPAGAVVVLSPWVTHRDPRWFPEPGRFDPDRWLPEAAAARAELSYFPFGAGTRVCIGERFAWSEARTVLSTILLRWSFRLASSRPVQVLPRVTLRPKGGLPMTISRR
jgi:cytochrome P450